MAASSRLRAASVARPLPILRIGIPRSLLLLEAPQLEILLVLLHRIQKALGLLAVDFLRAHAAIPLLGPPVPRPPRVRWAPAPIARPATVLGPPVSGAAVSPSIHAPVLAAIARAAVGAAIHTAIGAAIRTTVGASVRAPIRPTIWLTRVRARVRSAAILAAILPTVLAAIGATIRAALPART